MVKKIAVLSSRGGHGHTVSLNALKEMLGNSYTFSTYYPFNELSTAGFGKYDTMYNYFLAKGWFRAIGFLSRWPARLYLYFYRHQVEKRIGEWLDCEQPDLVLSIVPYLNLAGCRAAQARQLNYLLITLDYDLRNWIAGLKRLKPHHFAVTIGREGPYSSGRLKKAGIPDELIHPIGLPLRAQFFDQEPPKPHSNRRSILITLGGRGSNTTLDYVKRILSFKLAIDVTVICGHNERLQKRLSALHPPEETNLKVLGLVEDIAHWMREADLIILKPGPLTLTEALTLQKPVLMDATSGVLPWERANMRMIQELGAGYPIRRLSDLKPEWLLSPPSMNRPFENRFKEKIPKIIDALMPASALARQSLSPSPQPLQSH